MRRKGEIELVAWQTACLLNAWRGKGAPITVDRLLGRGRPVDSFQSVEEIKTFLVGK